MRRNWSLSSVVIAVVCRRGSRRGMRWDIFFWVLAREEALHLRACFEGIVLRFDTHGEGGTPVRCPGRRMSLFEKWEEKKERKRMEGERREGLIYVHQPGRVGKEETAWEKETLIRIIFILFTLRTRRRTALSCLAANCSRPISISSSAVGSLPSHESFCLSSLVSLADPGLG